MTKKNFLGKSLWWTIDLDVAEKRFKKIKVRKDVKLIIMTIDHHSMFHTMTTPTNQTYWPHELIAPTSNIFQPYINFLPKKFKKCKVEKMWLVAVISACGQ